MALQQETSPLTGILEEDKVYIDFGEHEGKSVLEVAIHAQSSTLLIERKESGFCTHPTH